MREDFANFNENEVKLSEAPTGGYGSENSVYLHGGRQPVNMMMLFRSNCLESLNFNILITYLNLTHHVLL